MKSSLEVAAGETSSGRALPRAFSINSDRAFWVVLGVCVALFLVAHIYHLGGVSDTRDERQDRGVVDCYVQERNPFRCAYDVSQTRFPFYVHAVARIVTGDALGRALDDWVSLGFGLFNLVYLALFARRYFGNAVAMLTAVLVTLSIPLAASSRMIMTHSNVIFVTFTLLSLTRLYAYFARRKRYELMLSAIFFGVSVGSSLLGAVTFVGLAIFYAAMKLHLRERVRAFELLFVPISILAFFGSSIFYAHPANFALTYRDWTESRGLRFQDWNYLGQNLAYAPNGFSFLLFSLKLMPAWTLMYLASVGLVLVQLFRARTPQAIFLASAFGLSLTYLAIKNFYFRYDAPHHQLHLFPLTYLTIAYGVGWAWRRAKQSALPVLRFAVVGVFALACVANAADYARFFPNLIFYGAQYGRNFIGEFYGPAVMHCQDQDELAKVMATLHAKGYRILASNQSCAPASAANFVVPYGSSPDQFKFEFAYYDYLANDHLRSLSLNHLAFKAYVRDACVPDYVYEFPTGVPAYQILRCQKSAPTVKEIIGS